MAVVRRKHAAQLAGILTLPGSSRAKSSHTRMIEEVDTRLLEAVAANH